MKKNNIDFKYLSRIYNYIKVPSHKRNGLHSSEIISSVSEIKASTVNP